MATAFGVSSLVALLAMQFTSANLQGLLMRELAGVAIVSGLVKLWLLKQSLAGHSNDSQLRGVQLRNCVRLQVTSVGMFVLLSGMIVFWPMTSASIVMTAAAIIAGLMAEVTERYLFFRAVVPLRMPGVVKA